MRSRTVHVAIPVQDEVDCLADCVEALRRQRDAHAILWFCVNQPEDWHDDDDRRVLCESNRRCLQFLHAIDDLEIRLLDRSSRGRGWAPKRGGVGFARKEIMDAICEACGDDDLIVSLDADTRVPPDYLQSVRSAFERQPRACALAARYLHPLTDDEPVTRAMLGYEIYMRFYALNLWRIGSPYAFTALGSALALPVSVYRALGGITPRTSGEDFYFLQKLVKHGRVLHWCDAAVEPGTRKSWRVPVGTGQAIVAACNGQHTDRYPLYAAELFDRIRATVDCFPRLFRERLATPLDSFLADKAGTGDLWQPLRENHRGVERFVRACHERLDGLRILQYLKSEYRRAPTDDRATLIDWLDRHGRALPDSESEARQWSVRLAERGFEALSVRELDSLRRMLFRMEDRYRRQDFLNE